MGASGIDFLENDRNMQDCFRQHPDIYGSELDDAEDEDDAPPVDDAASPSPAPPLEPAEGSIPAAATSAEPQSQPLQSSSSSSPDPPASSDTERARAAKKQVERDHGDAADESREMVPKAAHDATGAAIVGK